jgi:peptide/nickel transport system permease protein
VTSLLHGSDELVVPRTRWHTSLGVGMRRQPLLTVAVIILLVIAVPCALAALISPFAPDAQDGAHIFGSSSGAHWFGTDELGRDLFTRFLYGGQLSLEIAAGASAIAMLVGSLWGFTAAIRRGWIDEVLMRSADLVMATPQMLLALICAASFGAREPGLILIIGLLLAPVTARMVRGVALTEVTQDYYSAAIAYGAGMPRLLLKELLPNTRRQLALQASVNAASAILLEASLSFLGLGIQPPSASWGTLLRQGYSYLYQSLPYVLFPALGILLTIWMLNVVADQLGQRFGE